MLKKNENIVLDFIKENPFSSSSEIHERISDSISYATVKRILSNLVSKNLIFKTGKGKNTKYSLSPSYKLFQPIDIEKYYEKEIDERTIKENFNFDLIQSVLQPANLFTLKELDKLNSLQKIYSENISKLSDFEYKKELERLSIDLSWKSSQIEGNTYTLLETERLLKDKETALGKTREEAAMLLNHKEAIDFIIDNPDYFNSVAVSKIENIHSCLVLK